MTLSEKCKLYIKAGIAYENGENIISDETYDDLSRILLKRYNKLPKWFRNKISEDDLISGSAAEFSKKFLSDNHEVQWMISFEDFCDLMVERGYMSLEQSEYVKFYRDKFEVQ